MQNKQSELGQFFTTNANYILEGFEEYIENKDILDPFAGNQDLLNWALKNKCKSVKGFDIDKSLIKENISHNDSLINIPNCSFILTNPPYLAKNKMNSEQKSKYDLINADDFYLLSIKRIIEANPDEGIIIVPVNFLSAENSSKVRYEFLSRYKIEKCKYFTNQVFDNTTYNVIALYFKKSLICDEQIINFNILPENINLKIKLNKKYNFMIAGKELSRFNNGSGIKRLTEKDIDNNKGPNKVKLLFNDFNTEKEYSINDTLLKTINKNILVLSAIDTSKDSYICLSDIRNYSSKALVGKHTSRNIAYLILEDNISIKDQEEIITKFNNKLNRLRNKYKSLFLTNFRDNDRKRISFELAYKIINYILKTEIKK